MMKKLFCLFFVIVFLVVPVFSIGVSPGKSAFLYEHETLIEGKFRVHNLGNESIELVFVVEGDLKEFIELDYSSYSFDVGEETKEFRYSINLPEEEVFYPGSYPSKIIIIESSKQGDESVEAKAGVAHQLVLEVPYPGKYIEVYPRITSSYEEGPVVFLMGVKNKGDSDINEVFSYVEIFDERERLIFEFETTRDSVSVNEIIELMGEWDEGVRVGKFKSVMTTDYDGTQLILTKYFSVGEIFLEIGSISLRDFKLGGLAVFDFMVKNNLNQNVRNCYILVEVYHDGKEIGRISSAPHDLRSLSSTNIVAYWDTEGVEEGMYQGRLTLGYEEGRFEEDVVIRVYENDIQIIGVSGLKKIQRRRNMGIIAILNLILLSILFIIISIIFLDRKKKSKKGIEGKNQKKNKFVKKKKKG